MACGAVVGNSAVPALIASTAGGFVQPTGVSSSGGYGLDEDVATATITTGMGLVGTGTGTSGVSATTGATATATVVQEGKNGGSVVGGELKRVVVLGCLGVVAAAAFVVI